MFQLSMQSVGNQPEVVEQVFSPTKSGHISVSYPVEPPGERAGVHKISCQDIIDPAGIWLHRGVGKDVGASPSIELRRLMVGKIAAGGAVTSVSRGGIETSSIRVTASVTVFFAIASMSLSSR